MKALHANSRDKLLHQVARSRFSPQPGKRLDEPEPHFLNVMCAIQNTTILIIGTDSVAPDRERTVTLNIQRRHGESRLAQMKSLGTQGCEWWGLSASPPKQCGVVLVCHLTSVGRHSGPIFLELWGCVRPWLSTFHPGTCQRVHSRRSASGQLEAREMVAWTRIGHGIAASPARYCGGDAPNPTIGPHDGGLGSHSMCNLAAHATSSLLSFLPSHSLAGIT